MNEVTITEARLDLRRLIDQLAVSHQPLLITGRQNSAVLVSEEDWAAIQEILFVVSVSGMRKALVEGSGASLRAFETGADELSQ